MATVVDFPFQKKEGKFFAPLASSEPDYIVVNGAIQANGNKIVAGIHNMKAEYAEKMIKKGFQFVTVGSDQRFMSAGAKESVSKIKKINTKESKAY